MIRNPYVNLRILIVTAVILISAACNSSQNTTDSSKGHESSNAKEETTLGDDSIVASVNGTKITNSEVEKVLQTFMKQYQGMYPPEQIEQIRPTIRSQAVESLINNLVLLKEADKNKIQIDSNRIENEISKITEQFENPEQFHRQLEDLGLTEEEMRRDIEQNLRVETLLESKLPAVTVTPGDVKTFYRENSANFDVPEQIRVRHILFKIDPDADKDTKDKKHQELEGLRNKIIGGADFAELARQYSDCPTREQGGDLGFIERGKMVKPFEKTAFSLETGKVSEIVETQFGLHLIEVVEKKDGRRIPLEEVENKISEHLKSLQKADAFKKYLEALRSSAEIKYVSE